MQSAQHVFSNIQTLNAKKCIKISAGGARTLDLLNQLTTTNTFTCFEMDIRMHLLYTKRGSIDGYIYQTKWLSGRVLDSRPRDRGFEPHRRHCVVSLSKNLILVQPRMTRPFIAERLLMGRKLSNQTNKIKYQTRRRLIFIIFVRH